MQCFFEIPQDHTRYTDILKVSRAAAQIMTAISTPQLRVLVQPIRGKGYLGTKTLEN